jgi:acyl-CoA synthetase (AMP-forming)/AMP-acid ligase II
VRLVACGRQFEGHSVRVFEESDEASERPLPDRCVGEIRIQGPSVMTHYWDDSDKTRATFAGPYLRTGDLGFLDDGELYICGRSKEVIILNGRNYYPQDIEWEASKVSGVRKGNVIAFGARDPSGHERDRERVVVALEVQDEAALARATAIAAEVRSAVQAGIGLTLDDTVVLRAGTLPKTSSGKLQRAKTRELYEAGELAVRAPARDAKRVDLLKEAAKSQLSYFKLAVLGARRPKT